MTGVVRMARAPGRVGRGLAAVLAATTAVVLAGCGTIPPPSSAGSSTGALPSPAVAQPAPTSAAPTPGSGPSSPSAAPSPRPYTSSRARPTGPTKASPTPPPNTWVGHFQGHEVWVPRGHGATMSFTFDDGPWPGSTSAVLGLLAQHHVHAVFCLIGEQARADPTLVHREVAGGHELCDHSRDHDLSMNGKGARYVDAEVADGLADIRAAAPHGTKVTFYRQPGGLWDPTVVKAMDRHGLDPLRWGDDPRDWSRPGSVAIVNRVVSHLHPGVVVLMHDGGGDRSQSVAALRFLLGAVQAAGWTPVLAPHVTLSAKAAAEPQ